MLHNVLSHASKLSESVLVTLRLVPAAPESCRFVMLPFVDVEFVEEGLPVTVTPAMSFHRKSKPNDLAI